VDVEEQMANPGDAATAKCEREGCGAIVVCKGLELIRNPSAGQDFPDDDEVDVWECKRGHKQGPRWDPDIP
jgi:hypothetical protein